VVRLRGRPRSRGPRSVRRNGGQCCSGARRTRSRGLLAAADRRVRRVTHAAWSLEWNATAIEGDVAEEVSRLKNELDGDLFLIGCGELARHLIANGLVDDSGVTLLRYEPDLV
jgi:dihydrofolate reductase